MKVFRLFIVLLPFLFYFIAITPLCSAVDATPAGLEKETPNDTQILRPIYVKGEAPYKEPVLRKMDLDRISASAYYETYEGCRLGNYFPAKYFTIAQRVEIYEEPKPIDAHILDAKKIRWLHQNQPWDTKGDFRSQTSTPIFTRSYGTEISMSDPRYKDARLKYTHDYRDIYGNQFPIYLTDQGGPEGRIRNVNYKHERWDQNEVLLEYHNKLPYLGWDCTVNVGYRYSTMNAKNDGSTFSYYENRHTYLSSASISPSARLEYFGQFEYYKSKRPDSNFVYSPEHYISAVEIRMKSNDLKTSYIPRVSYSRDSYFPMYNRLHKTEMQFRVGHDFNKKLSATTTARYVFSIRNEVDNTAPRYNAPNPVNDMAAWVGTENRVQYNIFDRLWLQGGIDYSAGTNMSDFDNVGLLGGLEYYAPGLIRVDVGWRGNHYYNIRDYLSTIYFKFFLFM